MKKRIVLSTLAVLLLIPCVAVWWLSYTASGLQYALLQLNRLPGMQVHVSGVGGRIAGPLHLDRFELQQERVHVVAEQIDIDLRPALLLSGIVSLKTLHIAQLTVTQKPATHVSPDTGIHFLPAFLRIGISEARIDHARYEQGNGFVLDIAPLQTALSMTRSHLDLKALSLITPPFTAQGDLSLRGGSELALHGALQTSMALEARPTLTGLLQLDGTLKQLAMKVNVHQPQPATVDATLTFPNEQWQLDGGVAANEWNLPAWLASAPFTLRGTALKFSMNDAGVHVIGDTALPEWTRAPLHIDARGKYAAKVLRLQQTRITGLRGRIDVEATGDIDFNDAQGPLLDLQARWRGLQWPLNAAREDAFFSSQRGTLSLQGRQQYRYALSAQATPRSWTDSDITADGSVSAQGLQLARYAVRTLGGEVKGNASLQFSQPRPWRITARGVGLDPGQRFAAWPGPIDFNVDAQGNGFNASDRLALQLHQLSGRLRGVPLQAQAQIVHEPGLWQTQQLNASWGQSSLTAKGNYGSRNDLQFRFTSPALKQLYPDLKGQLTAEGRVSGEGQQTRLLLTASSSAIDYLDWQWRQLQLDTQIDLSDRNDSHIELKVARAARGTTSLDNIAINGLGRASEHGIGIQATLQLPLLPPDLHVNLNIHGFYDHSRWYGTLDTLRIADANDQQAAVLPQVVPFEIARDHAQLQPLCLDIERGRGCVQLDWQAGQRWQLQASAQSFPVVLRNAALQATTYLRAVLDAQVNLHAERDAAWQGTASANLSDAALHYISAGGRDEVLPVKRGDMRVDAAADVITTSGHLDIGSSSTSAINATIERRGDMTDWPLKGQFTLSSSDARLVPVFINDVDRADGQLAVQFALNGTVGNPQLNGNITLQHGLLAFYQTNLILRDLEFAATLQTDQLDFTARGNAGEGVLQSSGRFTWAEQAIRGNFTLQGDRLLVADLPEYHVLASPQLRFDINDRVVNVSGEVHIPEAQLQPKEITGAITTSADAHFKTDEVFKRGNGWSISSDVNVTLGDQVKFNGLGLQGNIGGAVRTLLRTGMPTAGRGELSVNDGQYEAYGRKLDIKRGRLIYDATPLDDPGLDIQAERVIDDTTVGVNVRGGLRDPRLSFYSTPSMSQSEIISYLIVGKKLDDLQSGEAASVRSATNSIALQGGGYFAGQLGRRIGIEQIGVETDSDNNSSLVLGKFLNPRLFVSYGISLSEAINTLKLRYTLSKRWSLKAESGAAQSADVVFKVER